MSGVFLSFLMCQVSAEAQKSYDKHDVRSMFRKSTKNLWINYLSGTADDCHVVDMIMGTDGSTCRGLYTLRSSQTTFFFDGMVRNNILHLTEYSTEDVPTGTLKATYDGENFKAMWYSLDKSRSVPMSLSIVSQFEQFQPSEKISSQWLRVFSGNLDGKNITLKIERLNEVYDITMEGNEISESVTLNGKGLSVEIFNPDFKSIPLKEKSIMVASSLPEKADILLRDENDYTSTQRLDVEQAIDYVPFSYAGFHSTLIGEIPQISHKKFDNWIKTEATEVFESVLQQHKKIKYGELGFRNKWVHHAECWVEWDLVTNEWLSGTLYMQSSLQKNMIKRAFIYDLRSSKLVNLEDFLVSKSDKDFVIEKAMYQALEEQYNPQNINIEDFKYVTMEVDGFKFTNDFCPVYGETTLRVPFKSIEQNLRNKNLLKSLQQKK